MNGRYLQQILEKSAEKNGADTPLTIGHLLNIVRMANREESRRECEREALHQDIMDDITFGECGDR